MREGRTPPLQSSQAGGALGGSGGASSPSLLHAALAWSRRGRAVLPLRPRSKEPLTAHGVRDATTDEATIRRWWATWPDANVGVATGSASGLAVLDVDPRNGGDESLHDLEARHGPLPDTVTALTGGGGQHLYFALPEGVTVRSRVLAPGLELKGDGGYVVAPPSVHPSGQLYRWELTRGPGEVPLAPLPAWLLGLARDGRSPDRYDAFDGHPIPEGHRHSHLVSLGGKLRRDGLSVEAIEAALLEENVLRCRPPLPEEEVRRIARSMATYPPGLCHAGDGQRPGERSGSSVPTKGEAVGTELPRPLSAADILAAPTAQELKSLPFLGHPGIVIEGWSHLLAAPPKCGKTEVVWACVREWDAAGLAVLWVSEEGEAVWAERLRRDQAQVKHVRWLLVAGRGRNDILAAIQKVATEFDVVVVDTLRHLFQVDEGDNAAIARVIASLDEAIGRARTRLYLHHTRKAPGQHGERTAGGLAFVGGVDRQLELGWDEHDDRRRILKGVSRIAPVPELLLGWQDGRPRVLGEPAQVALAALRERVLAVLTESWMPTKEVMAALGEPKPGDEQLRRALRSLAEEGLVERNPPLAAGEARGRPHQWRLRPPGPSSVPTATSIGGIELPPSIDADSKPSPDSPEEGGLAAPPDDGASEVPTQGVYSGSSTPPQEADGAGRVPTASPLVGTGPPPHPPSRCPGCRPAGLADYLLCQRGQEVVLLRLDLSRERHVLRSRQAVCFHAGLLRAIEPDHLVVSFQDGSWGHVDLATARRLGREGEFGAERQLAVPLTAFAWQAIQLGGEPP